MRWTWADMEEVRLAVENLLGPEAIRRKAKLLEPDVGKPLAKGIGSSVRIIGGLVGYDDHTSNHPLLDVGQINGLELPIIEGQVERAPDGRLHARIIMASGSPLAGMQELFGSSQQFDLFASDDYISVNPEKPTIFQNLYLADVPAGQSITLPGLGKTQTPFGFKMSAITEAIGFIEGTKFRGTMGLTYDMSLGSIPHSILPVLEARLGKLPDRLSAQGGGQFEVEVLSL